MTAPRLALTGLLRVTIIVSSDSKISSSTILKGITVEISPAKMVAVPAARVKSTPPPVAVPPVTA